MFLQKISKGKFKLIWLLMIAIIIAVTVVFVMKDEKDLITNIEILKSMAYDQVNEGDEKVENTKDNVCFDAFFVRDLNSDGTNEELRGSCRKTGEEDTLYINLSVEKGTLTDAQILVNENDNGNIYLQGSIFEDDVVKNNVVANNIKIIDLKEISNISKEIQGKIHSGNYEYQSQKLDALNGDINNYTAENTITLIGTYTDENGVKEDIRKTVEFTVDWYGEVEAEIPTLVYGTVDNLNQEKNISGLIDTENEEFKLGFELSVQETKNQLLLQSTALELTIPQLKGCNPLHVNVNTPNTDFEYDETTRILNVSRGEYDGILSDGMYGNNRINTFKIEVVYPIEAYDSNIMELTVPVSVFYEGYNNYSDIVGYDVSFENPAISNVATATAKILYGNYKEIINNVEVIVGQKNIESNQYEVSKEKVLNLYNSIPNDDRKDEYVVRWNISCADNFSGLRLNSNNEQIIKKDSTTENMEQFSKYTGIYFTSPNKLLGENGKIVVIDDETNFVLANFTNENWGEYTETNPYRYEIPVNKIRLETTEITGNSNISITNLKELDDDYIINNYEQEEFLEFEYIENSINAYLGETEFSNSNRAIYNGTEDTTEYVGDIDLKILKTEKDTSNAISDISFKLIGENYESGKVLKTNSSGEIVFKGLKYDVEYTLEEIDSKEYLKSENIVFVVNSDNTITINNGTVKESDVVEEKDNIIANLRIENEKITTYDLNINKIIKTENIGLPGVTYRLYCENEFVGEYITNHEGKITISGLYQYEAMQNSNNMYVLREMNTPNGYSKANDIVFRLENRPEDGIKFVVVEGNIKSQDVEDNTISIVTETMQISTPSFSLVKKDGDTGSVLPGAKFAIYSVTGENEEKLGIALDSNYNILGKKEIINGKTYFTLTTDENGQIVADLREGLYKAVEIEAVNDTYELNNNSYYFGIGIDKWQDVKEYSVDDEISTVINTKDGYIGYGSYYGSLNIGNENDTEDFDNMNSVIVKYDRNTNILWAREIAGDYEDYINTLVDLGDNGILAYIESSSSVLNIGDYVFTNLPYNNEGTIDYNYYTFGVMVKYDKDGNLEWAQQLGTRQDVVVDSIVDTENDGVIVLGNFSSDKLNINGNEIYNKSDIYEINLGDGFYIEFYFDGILDEDKTTFYNALLGTEINEDAILDDITGETLLDILTSKVEPEYEGAQVEFEGYEYSHVEGVPITITSGTKQTIKAYYNSTGSVEGGTTDEETPEDGEIDDTIEEYVQYHTDSLIIKYKYDGTIEWINSIGGQKNDNFSHIVKLSNGEYVVYGTTFSGDVLERLEDVGIEKPTQITHTIGETYANGIIIKLDSNGNILNSNIINYGEQRVNGEINVSKVLETSDNGFIVAGNYTGIINISGNELNNDSENSNSVIIKYSNECNIEWIKTFEGDGSEEIIDVEQLISGDFVILGTYDGASAIVEDTELYNIEIEGIDYDDDGNEIVVPYYSTNGILVRCDLYGNIKAIKNISGENYEQLDDVISTNDGGYIVLGKTDSANITIDDNYFLENIPDINIETEDDTDIIDVTYINNGFVLDFDRNNEVVSGKILDAKENKIVLRNNSYYVIGKNENIITEVQLMNLSNIEVLNYVKKYSISTKVKNNIGGTISGSDNYIYELVNYNTSNVKPINIVPDSGYEIGTVTVNGKAINIEKDEQGNTTLPVFTNVLENKLIEVSFVEIDKKAEFNVIDKETGLGIAFAEFAITEELENPITTNLPIKLKNNIEDNIVSINYPIDYEASTDEYYESGYTIEYYYDDILDGTDTYYVDEGTQITLDTVVYQEIDGYDENGDEILGQEVTLRDCIDKNAFDYTYLTTNLPIIVSGDANETKVKIFYTSEENPTNAWYKIEYSFNNVKNTNLTEIVKSKRNKDLTENDIQEYINKHFELESKRCKRKCNFRTNSRKLQYSK